MRDFSKVLGVALTGLSIGYAAMPVGREIDAVEPVILPNGVSTYFAAVAGGGAPDYNEISLKKNVLYFQRSLSTIGFVPSLTSLFFANGNDGQQTVRYLNSNGPMRSRYPTGFLNTLINRPCLFRWAEIAAWGASGHW